MHIMHTIIYGKWTHAEHALFKVMHQLRTNKTENSAKKGKNPNN